jgi:hypothetical protein
VSNTFQKPLKTTPKEYNINGKTLQFIYTGKESIIIIIGRELVKSSSGNRGVCHLSLFLIYFNDLGLYIYSLDISSDTVNCFSPTVTTVSILPFSIVNEVDSTGNTSSIDKLGTLNSIASLGVNI